MQSYIDILNYAITKKPCLLQSRIYQINKPYNIEIHISIVRLVNKRREELT